MRQIILPAVLMVFLNGCVNFTPSTLIESGEKVEIVVTGSPLRLSQCITKRLEDYPFTIDVGKTTADVRTFAGRIEIFSWPSLIVLEDIENGRCRVTGYVRTIYWKKNDLMKYMIDSVKICSDGKYP